MTIINIIVFCTCFLSPTDQKCAELSTFWQFFYYRPPGKFWYTAGEIVKMWCQELNTYLYKKIFCISSTWDYIPLFRFLALPSSSTNGIFRLSVCPSVTPFWLCSHHRIIMKFSGVITNDQNKVHAKGQGRRSKVKVTEVTTQLNRFRTVTPVWIHIWWWNDAYSLMLLRRGALLFFKVIRQISRSHGSKNRRIWPRLGVSGL